MIDNTWATPLYFKPFDHGVDLSIHAGTKYIVGHSDAMLGIISCADAAAVRAARRLPELRLPRRARRLLPRAARPAHHGGAAAPHEQSGVEIARWLEGRPEVDKVLHPALPDCPGHELLEARFQGLVRPVLLHCSRLHRKRAGGHAGRHGLFGMGASWGGYESLMIPAHPDQLPHRRAVAQGQAPAARPYRPGGRRGSQDRPRRRLRPAEPGHNA